MNRRLFLKALGIGAASAPVVTALFDESGADIPIAPTAAEPPKFANGGLVPGGKPYLVGERGPEMIVTVNSKVSPEQIIKALKDYERRNGRGRR